ncbi:MAG TPA: ferric reductase-like transmembrane domain-containing protein [Longimicrobiales bacterium]|nr:ferric reductase-like transmembrane domain-containing protein [Longimicrobiales bacterium]
MDRTIAGIFWILLYLAVVTVPVFLMLVPPVPSGRGFWLEFSVALGFAGLTQIGLQFLLIARFKRVTAPYGIDIILRYHRQIAMVAVAAVVLHPLILVIDNPSRLKLLNPLGGNWASRFALLSLLVLLITVAASVYRERLRLDYELWRLTHIGLGVAAIVFAQLHASMAGLYINTPWKQAIWIVMAAAMVGFIMYLRLLKPIRQEAYSWRVVETRDEGGDTTTLVLEADGHGGTKFQPGQFAWIKLSDSPFTLEEHPFSFSSSAETTKRIEFGIKALGDFSAAVADVRPGTPAYVDGPHGAFSMDRYEAAGYIFFAGGVGITPFMSMLRTMADRNDPRPVLLFYADRSLDETAFRKDLDELQEKVDLEVVYVLEEPPEDWDGEEGFITPEVLDRRLPDEGFERDCMICGPPPMMDAVHEALLQRGVPQDRIQIERFALA